MIEEYLLKKTLDTIFNKTYNQLKNTKYKLDVGKLDVQKAIQLHISSVKNWCQNVNFRDLEKAKSLRKIFIDLDLSLIPKRLKVSSEEDNSKLETIKSMEIFDNSDKHIVLLGQAGAGKTTILKRFSSSVIFDEESYTDNIGFPMLIKLNELNTQNDTSLIKKIYTESGLSINSKENDNKFQNEDIIENIIITFLEEYNVLLLLDGFDEIYSSNIRDNLITELHRLFLRLNYARIIITSRSSDFPYHLDNSSTFEICPLTEKQISFFAHKWFNNPKQTECFLKNIKISPYYDTAIRPLNLAHLCAIFERINKIPDKPKTVYRKIVNLLLEEWDSQKGIVRTSRYSKFETDRKFEFLTNLAYELTIKQPHLIVNSSKRSTKTSVIILVFLVTKLFKLLMN